MIDLYSTCSIHSKQSRRFVKKLQINFSVSQKKEGSLRRGKTFLPSFKSTKQDSKQFDFARTSREFRSNKVSEFKLEDDLLVDSESFPMIRFQKKTFREMMKQIKYEKDIQSLPPNDRRNYILYRLIQELFQEISVNLYNLLICQHPITKIFFVYFSDIEQYPVSKCCYLPVFIKIAKTIGGEIRCTKCNTLLTQFDIDEQVLWVPNKPNRLSNFIISGKFRTKSLASAVPQNLLTPREKEELFQKTIYKMTKQSNIKKIQNQDAYKFDLVRNLLLNSQMFYQPVGNILDQL
ncbi:hypothetical protein pb186bvf_008521 [Paramecium bursaria]